MCGITLCIRGIDLSKLHFTFDFFQLYRENPFNNFGLSQQHQDFFSYVLQNQLFINDFSPQQIFQSIQDRGPDAFHCYKITIPVNKSEKINIQEIRETDPLFLTNIFNQDKNEKNNSDCLEMYACCSVLHLRGKSNIPTAQPLFSPDTNNFILYNGEIYNVEKNRLDQFSNSHKYLQEVFEMLNNFNPFENDTRQFLNILDMYSKIYKLKTDAGEQLNYIEDVKEIINCFNADFGFIYVDVLNMKISFGKDLFGKRGLVLGLRPNGLCLSSCSINTVATEADLRQDGGEDQEEEGKREIEIKQNDTESEKNSSGLLKEHMKQKFLEKKYNNEYYMALEKTWIEIPSNKVISANINSKQNIQNDISLSFSQVSLSSLKNIFSLKESGFKDFEEDFSIATQKACESLRNSLTNILKNIILYKPFFEKHLKETDTFEEKKEEDQNHHEVKSELAILFSGGLDSTLLALLCSQILPENAQ